MTSAQFAILREILCTLPCLAPEQRLGYVAALCGDDAELRKEAESFLQLTGEGPAILRTGALTAAAREALEDLDQAWSGSLPERIGPYQILGILGQGGMGVVYRAAQTEPMRREVALKVMGGSIRFVSVARRFVAERQALAVMEHPNIARVLDAGTTEAGDPYFAMELVRGVPISSYSRRAGLRPRQRLELFLQVCAGVRHAHQKGIIHRDLKPSNVLVEDFDERPVAKIIDFGIARALESAGADAGLLTQQGQVLGTAEYMSPEQSEGDATRIDTRSDVYALGVMLYELLSGCLPYEIAGLSIVERARVIREVVPPPLHERMPSERLDSELDVIAQKALEKHPDDRYASVDALAEDIERYLRGAPLLAHPRSSIYELRKFVRRHRLQVTFAATLAILLVAFTVTLGFQLQALRAQRVRADVESMRAQSVSTFLQEMLASAAPFEAGMQVTVKDIVDQASHKLDRELNQEPAVRLELHRTLGNTFTALGEYDAAAHHLDSATQLAEELDLGTETKARLLLDRANLAQTRGDFDESRALVEAAMALGDDPAVNADAFAMLFNVSMQRSAYAEAESLATLAIDAARLAYDDEHEKVAAARLNLALLRRQLGQLDEAIALQRQARSDLAASVGESNGRYLETLYQLAYSLIATRATDGSEEVALLEEVLAGWTLSMGPDHPAIGVVRNDLAVALMERNLRLAEAEEHMVEVLRIWKAKLTPGHPYVISAYNNLGYVRFVQLDFSGAERTFQEGLELRKLADSDHVRWTTFLDNLAWCLLMQARAAEAENHVREAHRIRTKYYSGVDAGWAEKHSSAVTICHALVDQNRLAESEALGAPLLAEPTEGPRNWARLMLCVALASSHAEAGRLALADSLLGEALPFLRNGQVHVHEWLPFRIYGLQRAARLASRISRPDSAAAWDARAEELRQIALAARN